MGMILKIVNAGKASYRLPGIFLPPSYFLTAYRLKPGSTALGDA